MRRLLARGRLNLSSDQREFLLVMDALVMGFAYALGPERLQRSGTFDLVNDTLPGGMDFMGWACFLLAFGLIAGRFVLLNTPLPRISHAIGAGIFLLYALLIGLPIIPFFGDAESGAGWMHLLIIAWLHYRAGIEQPAIRRN